MARLRQDPDNPCILQQECLPDQWVTLFDASLCLQASPGQPGPGGPGPGSGETQQFCLKLNGNGQVLLPIAVQGDWLIELTQKQGGWTDGSGAWQCPNGQSYTLGLCTGIGGFNGGDPLPTALHASIVAQIDTLWYDGNGIITVPSGLTDQQVVFQMNDASLSDNHGDISFCVKVTSPVAAPIALAYSVRGSGPSSANVGQVITMHCHDDGAGSSHGRVTFSSCLVVTVLSNPGWVMYTGSGMENGWIYYDCASVEHDGLVSQAPTTMPAHTHANSIEFGGAILTDFDVQFRIDGVV